MISGGRDGNASSGNSQTKPSDRAISVVGMGKLGLCLATALAVKGLRVWGIDVDENKVKMIQSGRIFHHEPLLQDYLKNALRSGGFTAHYEYDKAIQETDTTLFVVNTPSLANGGYSNAYLKQAVEKSSAILSTLEKYHLFVVVSTVMPGTVDGIIRPLMEKRSGKRCGKDFGLCYNPEFIAMGSVIRDLLNPGFVLIGESDQKAGTLLSQIYEKFLDRNVPIERTNIINAEIAKISFNVYVTMKVSFSNFVGQLCEKVPSSSAPEIMRIIGSDPRIGSLFLTPALGYGGPCLPRDNRAFSLLARKYKEHAMLSKATDYVNNRQIRTIIGNVKKLEPAHAKIAVLGLSYKPDTDLTEESQALLLANSLSKAGYSVVAYDPAISNVHGDSGRYGVDFSVELTSSLVDCIRGANICIVATPWKEFTELTPAQIVSQMRSPVVIDCWGSLSKLAEDKRIKYYRSGTYFAPK